MEEDSPVVSPEMSSDENDVEDGSSSSSGSSENSDSSNTASDETSEQMDVQPASPDQICQTLHNPELSEKFHKLDHTDAPEVPASPDEALSPDQLESPDAPPPAEIPISVDIPGSPEEDNNVESIQSPTAIPHSPGAPASPEMVRDSRDAPIAQFPERATSLDEIREIPTKQGEEAGDGGVEEKRSERSEDSNEHDLGSEADHIELDYDDDLDLNEPLKYTQEVTESNNQVKSDAPPKLDKEKESDEKLSSQREQATPIEDEETDKSGIKKITAAETSPKVTHVLEDGEIDDGRSFLRKTCKFFIKGMCTWGFTCRFIHPGVNDKGNYSLIGGPGEGELEEGEDNSDGSDAEKEESPEPEPEIPAKPETAWERGLRQAKDALKRASRRKEMEIDIEDKKMHLSLNDVENKENEKRLRDPYYDSIQYDELDPIQATDLGDYANYADKNDHWDIYNAEVGTSGWAYNDPQFRQQRGGDWYREDYDKLSNRRTDSKDRYGRTERFDNNRADRDVWLHDKFERPAAERSVRSSQGRRGGRGGGDDRPRNNRDQHQQQQQQPPQHQQQQQHQPQQHQQQHRRQRDRSPLRKDAGIKRESYNNEGGWIDPWQRRRDKSTRQRQRSSSASSFSSRSSRSSSNSSFSSRSRSRTRTPTPLRNADKTKKPNEPDKPKPAETSDKPAATPVNTKQPTSPKKPAAEPKRARAGPEWPTTPKDIPPAAPNKPVTEKPESSTIDKSPTKQPAVKPSTDKPIDPKSKTSKPSQTRQKRAEKPPSADRRKKRASGSSSSSLSSSSSDDSSSSDSDSSTDSSSSSSSDTETSSSGSDSDQLYKGMDKHTKQKPQKQTKLKPVKERAVKRPSPHRTGDRTERRPRPDRAREERSDKRPEQSDTNINKGQIKLTLVNKNKVQPRKRVLDSPPHEAQPPAKKSSSAPSKTDTSKKEPTSSSKTQSKSQKPPGKPPKPGSGKKGQPNRREELLKQLKAVEEAIAKKRSDP